MIKINSTTTTHPGVPSGNPTTPRWLLVILLMLLLPTIVLARAGGGHGGGGGGHGGGGGGGHGFSGGHSSGGGWSGSHGSGFSSGSHYSTSNNHDDDAAFALFAAIAIFILAVILLNVYRQWLRQNETGEIENTNRATTARQETQAIAKLQEVDPQFDRATFLSRVQNAFYKMQTAWCAQEIESIRPCISDGIAERFTLQYQEQRDEGYRNVMDRIEVLSMMVRQAEIGIVFDAVTVEINAKARDYDIRLRDQKILAGSRFVEEFTEYWTFLRRHGSISLSRGQPGLMEGNCPNCGSLITTQTPDPNQRDKNLPIGRSAKCQSCGKLLHSGVHDWVLSEITQAYATTTENNPMHEASILAYHRQRDAGFSAEHIEDRASVIFWRWAKAQRLGTAAPLMKIASQNYCGEFLQQLKTNTDPDGRRVFHDRIVVNAVYTLAMLPGPAQDRAFVRIEWSSIRTAIDPDNSSERSRAPGGGLHIWIAVLARKPGITSNPELSLSSAHCIHCGAAQQDDAQDFCAYCNAPINDGQNDWMLIEMAPSNSDWIRRLMQEISQKYQSEMDAPVAIDEQAITTPGHAMNMIAWLAEVIMADGKITEEEKRLFKIFCDRQQLSRNQVEAILANAQASGSSPIARPADWVEAHQWLKELARAVAADGVISSEEMEIMNLAAGKIGLTEWDARAVANDAHTAAVVAARNKLRQLKQR